MGRAVWFGAAAQLHVEAVEKVLFQAVIVYTAGITWEG
jgi:hypothetical protein